MLLRELRERSYPGGYTMLKVVAASFKPKETAAPIVRFETGYQRRDNQVQFVVWQAAGILRQVRVNIDLRKRPLADRNAFPCWRI